MPGCRSCPADVVWVENAVSHARLPLDAAEVDDSRADEAHVYVVVPAGRTTWAYPIAELAERLALKEAVSTARARELVLERYELHESHFRTCPGASKHSKGSRRRCEPLPGGGTVCFR